jgi:DNA-binding GntR family transcriptional regulator
MMAAMKNSAHSRTDGGVELQTQRAIEGVRDMIVRRQLYPGQQIRQEEVAAVLGMSKSPVREALRALEMDGLVYHQPNQGYFTARFSVADLRQIYTMRKALETLIFRALPEFPADEIEQLRAINKEIDSANANANANVHEVIQLNREFHFKIFVPSNLNLIVREVERLWQISDSYRSLYLYDSFGSRQGEIVAEHEAMIDALADHDLKRLIKVADSQRSIGEERILAMLGNVSPEPVGAR